MTAARPLVTAAALLVLQGVTFVVALRAGKHSVVDTAWGIGIALAALASATSAWLFGISVGSWRELPALGPLLMSFILTRGTGARMTDRG